MPCKVKLNVKRIHCPNCNEGLKLDRYGSIVSYICSYCKGMWISFDDLKDILSFETEKIIHNNILTEANLDNDNKQNCPECNNHSLNRFLYHDNEFLFCSGCNGFYFDNDKLETLKTFINMNTDTLLNKQQDNCLMFIFSSLFSDIPSL